MNAKAIEKALAAPFDVADVKFKPQAVSGTRAMCVAFVDARAIMDRLDDVVGMFAWQDKYEPLADGCVVCRLSLCVEGHWFTKEDVGAPSEQPDAGDRVKAAFSDALKRAAVKFGIGRYLYTVKMGWLEYDPQTRKFKTNPQLPAWARPNDPSRLITKEEGQQIMAWMHAKSVTGDAVFQRYNIKRLGELRCKDLAAVDRDFNEEGGVWFKLAETQSEKKAVGNGAA